MNDSIFLLATGLISIVLSFIIITFFDTEGLTDASLNRDLNLIQMQLITICIDIVMKPIQSISTIGTNITTQLTGSIKLVFWFFVFTLLTILVHYYHATILTILSDAWTCALVPPLKNIITPLLQIGRIFYALFTPLLNMLIVMQAQILKAWYITAMKCNSLQLFEVIREFALLCKTGSISIGGFFGAGSAGGNFMTNDLVLAEPIQHLFNGIALMENVAICACARFELVFNIAFISFHERHLVLAIDNGIQVFIRLFQSLFRLLFGKLPDIYLINFKIERSLLEFGLAFDGIVIKSMEKMLLFLSDGEFILSTVPAEGPFSVGAHIGVSGWHSLTTLGFNGPVKLLSVFDTESQSTFDPDTWSMTKSLSHMHQAVNSVAVFGQWLFYVLQTLVTSETPLQVLREEDIPLKLACDWVRDVAESRYVPLHETIGCAVSNAGIAIVNVPFIAWGVLVEVAVKTLFTSEQGFFRTLQRWEGPTIPREKVYSCEDRIAATAFNYTIPLNGEIIDEDNPLFNAKGWIWTQDRGKCQCDISYGMTLDEGLPLYNPWCGQPSLTFDLFAPADALIMHVSHGLLGPGFGDALPFMKPTEGVDINVELPGGATIDKYIAFGTTLPPITRAAVESVRVLTRVALSWTDIITGRWFNYPVNCGHGLNRLQIEKKYSYKKTTNEKEWGSLSEEEKTQMRWHQCGKKDYSSSKLGSPLKLCEMEGTDKSINSKTDCMCNYQHPLAMSDQCKCIARYPDLDVTSGSAETGALIDNLFTSEQVSMHWCNSMIIEWTFQNTGAFADALDYMVSLGPLNPQCGPDGPVAGSTYLIANTPTLEFAGEFTDSAKQLEALKALTASYSASCTTGTTCDASTTFAPQVKAATTEQNSNANLPGCRIWGRYDFFCSAGLYVKSQKRVTMNTGRQMVANGMSVLTGNFADVNFDTLPRLCDHEKAMGALASMIAAIIPNMRTELKESFAKFINMIFQVLYIQSQRVVLVLGKMAVNVVLNFDTLTEASLTESFTSATVSLVDGYFWAFEYFFIATGDLLNAIADAGEICFSIVDVITMVREEVKGGLLDIVTLVAEILGQFMAALSGNADVIGPLFENLFKLWAEVAEILVQQVFKILGAVFDFFGPFGKILNILGSLLCNVLNTVLPPLLFVGGGTWEPMECLELSRRLGTETVHIDITQKIAESLTWNGTSICDHFMTDTVKYTFEELRPLEKATWVDCVENKILGLEVKKLFGSKRFPDDIFYNWKTKYVVGYDLVRATKLILQHYIMNENRRWGDVRLLMLEQGLDADLYINMMQLASYQSSKIAKQFQLTNMVETTLGFFDKDFKKSNSEAAKTWRVYSQLKSAADTTSSEWTRRDMSQQLYKAKDAMLESSQHLHNWWQTVGTSDAHVTHTDRAFGKLKHIFTKPPKNKLKSKKHQKLKVPIRTDLKTCEERGGGGAAPIWCTNCNIMDNAVEEMIFQITSIGEFYTNTERGFPFIMSNVSAYFDELIEYNADFFDSTFTTVAATEEIVYEKNALRWTFYVANDWNNFIDIGWTFITDYTNKTKKDQWTGQIDKFLNATTDFVRKSDDSYVPFYGYSFFYFYDYLLFSKCDLQESIFVTTSNQNDRVDQIDIAIKACLIALLILATTPYWSVIPLAWIANILVIITIVNYLFLYIVYGYQITCAPLMPYTLVEDLNVWYHTRLDPGCFYKLFPTMANGASDDTCLVCPVGDKWSNANIVDTNITGSVLSGTVGVEVEVDFSGLISYQDCAAYIPDNYVTGMLTLSSLMDEYFIFWPMIFWLRKVWPGLSVFLIEWSVVDLNTSLGKLALASYQNEPIDEMWNECANIMFLDNIVAGAAIAVVGYIIVQVLIVIIQTLMQIIVLIMYIYNLLVYISLAIEISIVEKAKLQQAEEIKKKKIN